MTVRMLHEPAEMVTAERFLQQVWGSRTAPLEAATLTALAHAGNYVAGAFEPDRPDELVACSVGFFGPPAERSLHSHITGVARAVAGRGVGMAIKRHQRSWCLEQGVVVVTWTFDPAIARNAHFNLAKLGVDVISYLEDFYGTLDDDLNAGSPTDRLLVRWDLHRAIPAAVGTHPTTAAALATAMDGSPLMRAVDADASAVLVQVPDDIESLRRTDPALAVGWRLAVREALGGYLGSGDWRVTAFLRQDGYLLERTS